MYASEGALNATPCRPWCTTDHDYAGDGRLCVGERDVFLPEHLDVRAQQRITPSGEVDGPEVFVAVAGTTIRLSPDEATRLAGALAWVAKQIDLAEWHLGPSVARHRRDAEATPSNGPLWVGRHRSE